MKKLKTKIKTTFAIIKIFFEFSTFKNIKTLLFTLYVKKYRAFYTHIDYLPIFNFAEILKGNYEYFYSNKKYKKYPKLYFDRLLEEMYYQFKVLNNEQLRDKAKLAILKSKNTTAKTRAEKFRYKNEYNTLEKKIEEDEKENVMFDLNDFTDFIEHTFSQPVGSLNVHTTSTSKAYSNYQKALKKVKAINKKK